jgi:hypothetical protein
MVIDARCVTVLPGARMAITSLDAYDLKLSLSSVGWSGVAVAPEDGTERAMHENADHRLGYEVSGTASD